MKSFKKFINESPYMWHGSPHNIDTFKPNRGEYMIDRAIGTHFAADPDVAKKFAAGLYRDDNGQKKVEGNLYRTRAPTRAKLLKMNQNGLNKKQNYRYIKGDQNTIASHVTGTVFSRPENKEMFKSWAKYARNIDDATAEDLHHHLSTGKAPSHPKFGCARCSQSTNFHSYMANFDSTLVMEPREGFKQEVVHKYLDHMRSKGIHGLVYKNTSPMETKGARSRKSYVIFHPENHKPEKV